jgi:hypothetical protein
LFAEVGSRSYDSNDKDDATLLLTIYPHQNNAEDVSSLSITVYTDRQLTRALGMRSEVCSVYVDAIASLADETLDVPLSRAEQGWSGSTMPGGAEQQTDKEPAQIESVSQSLGSNATTEITKSSRSGGHGVELKVSRQTTTSEESWDPGYASHSNHHPFSGSPPSNLDCSAS